MTGYTEQEEKNLNDELRKLQTRASKLIGNNYYDAVRLNDLQYSALKTLTNAETHKDINWYLWNSGLIESTLNYIAEQIKTAKKNR